MTKKPIFLKIGISVAVLGLFSCQYYQLVVGHQIIIFYISEQLYYINYILKYSFQARNVNASKLLFRSWLKIHFREIHLTRSHHSKYPPHRNTCKIATFQVRFTVYEPTTFKLSHIPC